MDYPSTVLFHWNHISAFPHQNLVLGVESEIAPLVVPQKSSDYSQRVLWDAPTLVLVAYSQNTLLIGRQDDPGVHQGAPCLDPLGVAQISPLIDLLMYPPVLEKGLVDAFVHLTWVSS